MTLKVNKHEKGPCKKELMGEKDTSMGESLLVKQRLRNLIELAIVIGQKEGLLGNHKEINSADS